MRIISLALLVLFLISTPCQAVTLNFDTTGWTNHQKNRRVSAVFSLCKKAGFVVRVTDDGDDIIVADPIPAGLILDLIVTPSKLLDEVNASIVRIKTDADAHEAALETKQIRVRQKLGNLSQAEFDELLEIISWRKDGL